ncbi:MAG: hypothetical protein HYX61_01565 [Gammaproteobacteria bacterium]|jgi:hypothetical protein|nr:hypothetical protein [Gammaproteobacteria bacterium]
MFHTILVSDLSMKKLAFTFCFILTTLSFNALAHDSSASQSTQPQICKCKEKLAELENKTQRQYKPFNHTINGINLIIYPVKDGSPLQAIFDPKNKKQMITHIEALYAKHAKSLHKGTYHILFVWNLDGKRMTDIWVHNMNNVIEANSGPLLDSYVFKDLESSKDAGIASGDSIIVLGREEELRRKLKNTDIKEYVNREKHMPDFPKDMVGKSFFS